MTGAALYKEELSKKSGILLIQLQIKRSSLYVAVFPALTGQVNPAQGVALGWVKLGFQPERNTGYSFNLQAGHIFAILFGQRPLKPNDLSFRPRGSPTRFKQRTS
jgi:hypothetical protein